jgi:DNA primase
MANPGDFSYTVKQQADIVRIVGEYVKLKKAGAQNYSGLCPFHNEKTPSFSVHATRQFYHCFGCGASGDIFSFVQKIENITFPEAVRTVAQKLGIALPKISYSSPAEAEQAKKRTVLLDIHERACSFFQECLRRAEGARAHEYLAGRGLNEEMLKTFRIGYAPDSGFLLRDRLRGEFDEATLRDSGLFSWKQDESTQESGVSGQQQRRTTQDERRATAAMYSKFRNRVMFPITNETGRVIAFTGRTLATDEKAGPKYLNSPETAIYSKSRVLFNLDQAKEAIRKLDYAILVEGQMDCISVYAAGFRNVIASSGTAFTELQANLLGRFSKNVVVNFDPDTAGAKATERTLGLLVEEEFQIKVLTLEAGFDPDLFIRRKGKDAYEAALRKSQRYFDYLIERARAQFPIRNPEGKTQALKSLLPHFERLPNWIMRADFTREISQKLEVDLKFLERELRHAASGRSHSEAKRPLEISVSDAETVLVRALASEGELLAEDHQSAREGAEQGFDPARQAFFALREERLHAGLAAESLIEALLQMGQQTVPIEEIPLSDEDRHLLMSILTAKEQAPLTVLEIEGAVRALRRKALNRRLKEIERALEGPARVTDRRQQLQLTEERMRLKRALMDPGLLEQGSNPPAA